MSKWLVKIQGYEYETNIDELKQWVIEGRVLPRRHDFPAGIGLENSKRSTNALREAFEEQRKEASITKGNIISSIFISSISLSTSYSIKISQVGAIHATYSLLKDAFGYLVRPCFLTGLFAFPGFLLFGSTSKRCSFSRCY
jgi:hypothetical protein